jgi:ATP-dependent Clp protease ATP-binding subunit ClpC
MNNISNLGESGKLVLSYSERISRDLKHDYVGTDHLFLGVAELVKLAQNLREMMRKGEWPKKFYAERKTVEQPGIDKTSGILKNLGRDLTADAEQGTLDPIIGREDEILTMMKILSGRRKNNPILIGDAGVGKTAVVEGLAQVIVSEKAPPALSEKRIRTVEMVSVVAAGAKYVGQFEKKLQQLIKEAEKNPNPHPNQKKAKRYVRVKTAVQLMTPRPNGAANVGVNSNKHKGG